MLKVGDKVLIRTVTLYDIGEIEQIDERWIRLKNASWVADTGRLSTALETGRLNEVEKFPNDCTVAIAAIVDILPWVHELPAKTV